MTLIYHARFQTCSVDTDTVFQILTKLEHNFPLGPSEFQNFAQMKTFYHCPDGLFAHPLFRFHVLKWVRSTNLVWSHSALESVEFSHLQPAAQLLRKEQNIGCFRRCWSFRHQAITVPSLLAVYKWCPSQEKVRLQNKKVLGFPLYFLVLCQHTGHHIRVSLKKKDTFTEYFSYFKCKLNDCLQLTSNNSHCDIVTLLKNF